MGRKGIALLLLPLYLIFSFSCAHQAGKKYVISNGAQENPPEKISWWQKEENQWLISTLLILSIGLATSASIIIIYNSGGLFIKVKK